SLLAFDHTNVATLIYGVRMKGDLAVLSEWVDGESLESSLAAPSKPSLDALLRVVVDACEGLTALHTVEGGKFVCGALGPDDVFLGVDGVTRITRFNLGRTPPGALGEKRRASMAPEFVRGEKTPRVDVFAAGKLLEAALSHLSGEDRGALADVIARATAEDPAARYATPKELAQAVGAASKVASRAVVSQYVAKTFGQQIESRLAKLEPKVGISLSMTPPPVSAAPPELAQPPVEVPKIVPPPVIDPPKIDAKPEPKKSEPKIVAKAEPKPEVKSEPRLPQIEAKKKEPEKKELEKKEPEKKEAAKAPIAAVVAKKAVPLPAMTKKTNGSTQATTPAKSAVAPKAKEIAPAPPPIEVPITISEPPPSGEELSEMDVDIASVRPPPIVRDELKIDIMQDAVSPKAVSVVPPPTLPEKTKSVRPPKAASLRPAKSIKPAPAVAVDDEEIVMPKRGTNPALLLLGAIVIGGAGFAAGRMTAPDAWPPTPTSTSTATPPPSATATATMTSTPTPTSTSSASSTAGATSSTSAMPSASTGTRRAPYTAPPSAAPSASGRYSPGAI
ncbi:MAG TPA: hypothetical protein VGH87_11170, partial [Polyangiaceae bacterium]